MTEIKKDWFRLQCLVERELYEQLRTYSFKERISMSEIARQSFIKFLKEHK